MSTTFTLPPSSCARPTVGHRVQTKRVGCRGRAPPLDGKRETRPSFSLDSAFLSRNRIPFTQGVSYDDPF